MKVYFGTSPRIKQQREKEVFRIYNLIGQLGYKHTSDWVAKVKPEEFYKLSTSEFNRHHRETLKDIREADICVFEASSHSLSIGYLVNYSLDVGKPVVVLAKDKKAPFIFKRIESDKLFFVFYNGGNLEKELKSTLKDAAAEIDVRFNFFISPQIVTYLDWIAKKRRIPRSVFLRGLLEREMKKDKEYQKEGH